MYVLESRVRYSECDETGRLSLVGMINYLQDCATMHSEDLGIGVDYLRERHYGWFISAWQIEIFSMPKIGTPIKVCTACYDLRGQTARRNFLVLGPDDEVLIQADSSWFVFDTLEQRIIKAPESERAYLEGDERIDMEPLVRKIKVEGEGVAHDPITITEQHLDTNGHVNNAQYVRIAVNVVGGTHGVVPRRINVQYKLAAHLGDVMVPVVHDISDGIIVDLTDGQGGSFAIVKAVL